MNRVAPFLWFKDNAEQVAEFYLSVFPNARKLDEKSLSDSHVKPPGPPQIVKRQ